MVHGTFFGFDCVYTCAGSLIRNVISHQRLKFKKITIKSLKSQSSEAFILLLNKLKINHSNLSWIPNQSNRPDWKINALNSTLIRMWIRGFPKLCFSRTLLQDVCSQYLGCSCDQINLAKWEILHIIFPSWTITMHIIKSSDKLCRKTETQPPTKIQIWLSTFNYFPEHISFWNLSHRLLIFPKSSALQNKIWKTLLYVNWSGKGTS